MSAFVIGRWSAVVPDAVRGRALVLTLAGEWYGSGRGMLFSLTLGEGGITVTLGPESELS